MSWCQGLEDARVLLAPAPAPDAGNTAATGKEGYILNLCHPKSGSPTCYILMGESLQEIHWFKQSYGSWFLGDYVCQDGSLYISTPVDPIFILLPIFDVARMKKGSDSGKFRQLVEILYVEGYPCFQHLLSVAEKIMYLVCDVKEIGSSKFFRLDDLKVLAWLCQKVNNLQSDLAKLDKNYAVQEESERLRDAVSLLAEYLKDQPWLMLLCNHLNLDIDEVLVKMSQCETLPALAESSPSTPQSLQGKNVNAKSMAANGKQSKKLKTETNSRNIKDMFSKASGRRQK